MSCGMLHLQCKHRLHFSGIIVSSDYDQHKYFKISQIVDGHRQASIMHYNVDLDDFKRLREFFQGVSQCVTELSMMPSGCCSLCSALQPEIISHGNSGCPRMFNHCFKCIGRHASKLCSGEFFKVPQGYCWTCWMPLQSFFGVQFHSEDVGSRCSSPARDVLKHLVIVFFHDRTLVRAVTCTAVTAADYGRWLFQCSSQSVAGEGQVPNILRLFTAAFRR